jgi:hypothetical protein
MADASAAHPPRLDDLVTVVDSLHPGAPPLEQLAGAVELAEQLGELADHLIGHFVDLARRAGASWTEIGQSLGVSKQAVQKRFVANAFPEPDELASGRFSRFTPRAKSVVSFAQAQAREAGHPWVLPLHVLLGLLHEHEALAAQAIIAQQVPLDDVHQRVAARLATEPTGTAADHVKFAPSSKRLLALTLREALLLGHNYIGTEHMLLAMLAEPDDAAGHLLVELGVQRAATEAWLQQQLRR